MTIRTSVEGRLLLEVFEDSRLNLAFIPEKGIRAMLEYIEEGSVTTHAGLSSEEHLPICYHVVVRGANWVFIRNASGSFKAKEYIILFVYAVTMFGRVEVA